MATKSIKVSVNLDGLRGELQRSLEHTIHLIAAGLSIASNVSVKGVSLPGKSVSMLYDSLADRDSNQFQNEFRTWLLINGFRDSIESVSSFLESSHKIVSFWELSTKQKDGQQITGADWQNTIIKGGQQYHKLGFPDKLDHLKSQHGLSIDSTLESQVKSINVARNCLVHRNAIVTERDLNVDGHLEVKWSRMALVIKDKDGEKEFLQGSAITVYEGNLVGVRNKEDIKRFSLGDKIAFSSQEFADITWGLFLFGEDIVMKINKFGLENGFIRAVKDTSA